MNKMLTWDAQAAVGFVLSQTTHIESEVNRIEYPDIQYAELVPVDTSAHPFAKTVTYFSADMYGQAKWINGNSDDVPIAGSERAKHETSVYTAGIGYAYGWEEIGQAQMLGVNLPAEDATAARRAYEEMVDNVALRGDAAKGFNGLFNNPLITPTNAPNGDWGGTGNTFGQVIEDFNYGIRLSWSDTKFISIADTVLLPHEKLDWLNTVVLDGTTMTLLSFLRANNTYTNQTGRPLTIRGVRGLETAGVGGTQRMVAYRRNPQVLKMHIPMPHRFLQPFSPGPLRVEVPGVFRLGGLDIRRPAEVKYIDGI